MNSSMNDYWKMRFGSWGDNISNFFSSYSEPMMWFISLIWVVFAGCIGGVLAICIIAPDWAISSGYDYHLLTNFLNTTDWHHGFLTNVLNDYEKMKSGQINSLVETNFLAYLHERLTTWNDGWFKINSIDAQVQVTNAVLYNDNHLTFTVLWCGGPTQGGQQFSISL